MNIRIVSGKYGGRKIDAPTNSRTHPMSERIRNAIFNKLQAHIAQATVLDAFAGTGSLGLEAISRGAKTATFIERDRIAQKILTKNIVSLAAENQAKIVRASVSGWLETSAESQYDVIFADPPYHDPQAGTVAKLGDRLAPGGVMVVSWPKAVAVPTIDSLELASEATYGNAKILVFAEPN